MTSTKAKVKSSSESNIASKLASGDGPTEKLLPTSISMVKFARKAPIFGPIDRVPGH